VLIIDDSRDAADSLGELVELLGHVPIVAYDAERGLTLAAAEPPDVVLCDIGLPGIDGYEFARRFRAMSGERRARLVAVSGYAQPEDVARAREAGFDDHVAKPPDPAEIERLIG
jgi:CheY-like chemotaxis protein